MANATTGVSIENVNRNPIPSGQRTNNGHFSDAILVPQQLPRPEGADRRPILRRQGSVGIRFRIRRNQPFWWLPSQVSLREGICLILSHEFFSVSNLMLFHLHVFVVFLGTSLRISWWENSPHREQCYCLFLLVSFTIIVLKRQCKTFNMRLKGSLYFIVLEESYVERQSIRT